jgi:hypothetical protein
MNSTHTIRLLSISVAVVLASCGGGGGDEPPAPDAVTASAGSFSGTAYLSSQTVSRLAGREYGLNGSSARDLITVCNSIRAGKNLPASPAIDPAVLASLDVQTTERYFDNGVRAASYTSGRVLDLPDLQRWKTDAQRDPVAALPPDCAQHVLVAIDTGLLWRDGLRYDISFRDRTAKARSAQADFAPQTLVDATEVARWPSELQDGQSCKVAATESPLGSVGSCIWQRFPLQKLLNWPWVLRSEATLGSGAAALTQTTSTLGIENNRAVPEDKLRVPDGFTVTGP